MAVRKSYTARRDYYVYVLVACGADLPFYIGKGTGNRAFRHRWPHARETGKRANYIRQLNKHGIAFVVIILHSNLIEEAALRIEGSLIDALGRAPIGPLMNNAPGGLCKGTGPHSPEWNANMGAARRGLPLSKEAREHISASLVGRKLSDEHKARIGAAHKGKVISEAQKEKMRATIARNRYNKQAL